jgi:glycosyltransferase involved in cell wall biosynthesis
MSAIAPPRPASVTKRDADVLPDRPRSQRRPVEGRVVLVSTNADLAGAPLHVRTLALELSERGFAVAVVFGQEGPVEAGLRAAGITCHVVPTMRSEIHPAKDRRSIDALARLLRAHRPDVVHAHSAKAGMVARIAARRLGIPCVYTVHGWGFGPGRPWLRALLLGAVERSLVGATDRFIAVSEVDARLGRQRLAIPSGAITTIRNGIADTPWRARPAASRVVAMVARDCMPKDYATLLRAAAGLDCEVWCIGSGTDTAAFRDAARRTGADVERRVRFLGARTDVAELLARCGVFVLSSDFEGLPLSVIEAMRAGLPTVASDVGGMRELVAPGRTGMLFAPRDHVALRSHLESLLAAPERRDTLGATARRVFERRFALAPMIDRTIDVYRHVRQTERAHASVPATVVRTAGSAAARS